jgi:hypothetical protein
LRITKFERFFGFLDSTSTNSRNPLVNNQEDYINKLLMMVAYGPEENKILLNINNDRRYLEAYYKRMETLVMDFKNYEISTLIRFSNAIVSNYSSSVVNITETMYQRITEPNFLNMLLKHSGVSLS